MIVTLTSIPPRFGKIGQTLRSLLDQRDWAERVILYVPERYRRFPEWDGALPEVPEGVEIRRCPRDYGPATKVLPALCDFAGQDVDLIYCDDDRIYPRDWLTKLVNARKAHKDCAIAPIGYMAEEVADATGAGRMQGTVQRSWRVTDLDFQARYLWRQLRKGRQWRDAHPPWRRVYKRSGYVDIAEGCGGVMVRPGFFGASVFDIPQDFWMVDDIWLSGMLWASGTPIWLIGNQFPPEESEANVIEPLVTNVVGGFDRVTANRQAAQYFQTRHGIWA